MIKKLLAVLFIIFLLLFSFSCGSSDSTSSSSNLAPGASFINDFNTAIGDLSSDASESNFDSEFHSDIFSLDGGIVSKFSYFLDLYTDFRNNAEYNNEEDRWEATLEGNELIVYGSYVEDSFYIRLPSNEDLSIYYYPDEGSITINIVGTPDSLDPSFRAELYKSGDYYYGFILEQKTTTSAYMTKFKYNISEPAQEFGLYYGRYVPLAARIPSVNYDIYQPQAPAIEFDIDEYEFIRFRMETPETWYTNSTDINQYVYLYFDQGVFGYDTFIY